MPLRQFRQLLAALFGLSSFGMAGAVVPESGMYWNPAEPGTGYYIEHQNGRVAVAVYTYDADGRPTFYTASGELRSDASTEPTPYTDGLFPIHGMTGDLYRSEGGSCLQCDFRPVVSSAVAGRITLTFAYESTVEIRVRDLSGIQSKSILARRFNFGFIDWLDPADGGLDVDMRGEWIFVDESDPTRLPWRFHFTEVVRTPPDATVRDPREIRYFDRERNGEYRCIVPDTAGMTRDEVLQLPRFGCELFINGTVLLSVAHSDRGLNRLEAYLGALPTRGSTIARRPGRVIGLRVE